MVTTTDFVLRHETSLKSMKQSYMLRIAIVLVYMIFGILLNSVGAVNLLSIETLGASKAEAALLDAFKDLPIAIVSFVVASFLPRLGYKRAVLLGLVTVGAACFVVPMMQTFVAIKLLFVIIGAAFAIVKVSVYSMIGLLTDNERAHTSFTNFIEAMFMVGVLMGFWLFGWFANQTNPASSQWMQVYWVLAAIIALATVMLCFSELNEAPVLLVKTRLLADFSGMIKLVFLPLVLIFIGSAFLYVLIEQGIGTWLPTFNQEVLKMPAAMSIWIATILPATAAVGRFGAAYFIRKMGWYRLVNGCLLCVVGLILLTMPLTIDLQSSPSMTWLHAPAAAYLLPLIGLFLAPVYPAIISALLSVLPKAKHAGMMGLVVVFSALGGSTGSLITGHVFNAFNGTTAFYLLIIPAILLIALLYLFKRSINQMMLDMPR